MTNTIPAAFYVDADACPVKEEVYRVARRYLIPVKLVANAYLWAPDDALIERVVVEAGPDAADDWIAERVQPGDVVVTADIPLASRCLKSGAEVVGPRGEVFSSDTIGSALAGRAVMEHLRALGEIGGGPKPFRSLDKSRFLQTLDAAVHRARRAKR
jgi:uncharacterized protein YaiI (UPF0178 family)